LLDRCTSALGTSGFSLEAWSFLDGQLSFLLQRCTSALDYCGSALEAPSLELNRGDSLREALPAILEMPRFLLQAADLNGQETGFLKRG
jgi:hypothetical protein